MCIYSAGLCIYCTDRKKMIQGCKNPSPEAILNGFLYVIVKVLNNYNNV